MNYYHIFNLCIIAVILYRTTIGGVGGLFNESTNLTTFLISSGLSITFFEKAGTLINSYLCPSMAISLVIALWLIFTGTYTAIWILKSHLMAKVFQSTRTWKVPFPAALDKVGGIACGLTMGALMTSFFILSLYISPLSMNFYKKARIEEGVMLRIDELLPRTYAAFTRNLPYQAGFNSEGFLSKYKERITECKKRNSRKKENL